MDDKRIIKDYQVTLGNLMDLRDVNSHLKLMQEALMDAIDEGIMIFNKKFELVDINNRASLMFNLDESKLKGKKDHEIYQLLIEYFDEDSQEKFRELTQKLSGKDNLIGESFEAKVIKPREIFVDVTTRPIFENYEGFIGRIWKFRNITEQKNVDEMKNEFISIASHQLRTPLSVIHGNLDMISEGDFGKLPDYLSPVISDIKTASKKLIDLVNDLLNISRLDMGRIEPQFEEVDMNIQVQEIIDLYKIKFDAKKQIIKTELITDLKINTDPKLFAEALKNYLSNAIKYTPENGEIMIKAEEKDNMIHFSVSDSGLGIPENQRDNLFNKFFRADNVLKENFEGTGLGLYYVKKVINALGGQVGYEPLEKGSKFYFTLPK